MSFPVGGAPAQRVKGPARRAVLVAGSPLRPYGPAPPTGELFFIRLDLVEPIHPLCGVVEHLILFVLGIVGDQLEELVVHVRVTA